MTGYQSKRAAAQDKLDSMERETLKLALEALEFDGFTPDDATHRHYTIKAITAIKAAMAQPAQEPWPEEPVGHMAGGVQPPQRTWVGLTDEQIEDIAAKTMFPINFARAIEQLSKELNA